LKQLLERVRGLERSLQALDLAAARRAASEAIGQRIESAVVDALSRRPGDDHAAPWQETGVLHGSIGHEVSADSIVVGSTDPAAVFQEAGTREVPPRPFLAPAGIAAASDAAAEIGAATAEALREALR
jgi:hypothetical protein